MKTFKFNLNNSLTEYLIDFSLLSLLSILTVNKLAPSLLNADVILNSIMSLQKVTLFYWGQNRLLNLVPFILSPITNPGYNLAAHLVFFSFTFFLLLYVMAGIIKKITDSSHWISQRWVFILLVLSLFFLFTPNMIFELAIAHIEYSLSYLLMILAFMTCFKERGCSVLNMIASSFLLFVATGVNFSIFIPASFISLHFLVTRKNLSFHACFMGATALVSFITWILLSKLFPDPGISYSSFDFSHFIFNLKMVLGNIKNALYPWRVAGLFIVTVLSFLFLKIKSSRVPWADMFSLIIFSILWIILFSNNAWVHANQYHVRYFAPVFLSIMMLLVLLIILTMGPLLKQRISMGIIVLLFLFSISSWLGPLHSWDEYSVLQRIEKDPTITETGRSNFYAGDYWHVWPSVMRDLIHGTEAYGLCYRGDANRELVFSSARNENKERGYIKIQCMNSSEDECKKQAENMLGRDLNVIMDRY